MAVPGDSHAFDKWPTRTLKGHSRNARALEWNFDGRRLASASSDMNVRIWNPERADSWSGCFVCQISETGSTHSSFKRLIPDKNSSELRGHSAEVQSISWSPTSAEMIASGSTDCSIKVWDIRQGKAVQTISTKGPTKPNDGALLNVVWSPDGNYLGSGDRQDRLRFIDTRTWEVVATHDENARAKERSSRYTSTSEVNEFLFSPDSKSIIITFQSSIQVYSFPDLEHITEVIVNSSAPTNTLSRDPKGRFIAVGGMDGIVGLWDLRDFYCRQSYSKLDAAIRSIGISFDGELLAYCSGETSLEIASTQTGESLHTISTKALPNSDKKPTLSTLAWHPSRYYLAYAGEELSHQTGSIHVFGL